MVTNSCSESDRLLQSHRSDRIVPVKGPAQVSCHLSLATALDHTKDVPLLRCVSTGLFAGQVC
jgi:hypothetical protein